MSAAILEMSSSSIVQVFSLCSRVSLGFFSQFLSVSASLWREE